jgi:hypothetical protein
VATLLHHGADIVACDFHQMSNECVSKAGECPPARPARN